VLKKGTFDVLVLVVWVIYTYVSEELGASIVRMTVDATGHVVDTYTPDYTITSPVMVVVIDTPLITSHRTRMTFVACSLPPFPPQFWAETLS
jgi:hypothetical protein